MLHRVFNYCKHRKASVYCALRGGGNHNPLAERVLSFCKFKSCKAGFTLAEVLITLGIVGVVATLTIPNLVSNYEETAYATKLKKVYSRLEQARIMALDENWGILPYQNMGWGGVYVRARHVEFADTFKKYMKVATDCTGNGKNGNSACYGRNYWIKNPGGATNNIGLPGDTFAGYTTSDGVTYWFYGGQGWIIVDLNGSAKGPNINGVDVFWFSMNSNRNLVPYGNPQNLNECKTTGRTCTDWVLKYGNQAYRRCPDRVEYDGRTRC